MIALTVAVAVLGVVLWGTISGAMLPLILRRFGVDPATSSAPFVATLVDVTGLIIYFTAATFNPSWDGALTTRDYRGPLPRI